MCAVLILIDMINNQKMCQSVIAVNEPTRGQANTTTPFT